MTVESTKPSKDIYKLKGSIAPNGRSAFSVAEFARAIGISRGSVYALIAAGELKSLKLGDRRIIPASELQRLLSRAA
jgi:excisionase family DNA binding protein